MLELPTFFFHSNCSGIIRVSFIKANDNV